MVRKSKGKVIAFIVVLQRYLGKFDARLDRIELPLVTIVSNQGSCTICRHRDRTGRAHP